MSWTIGAGKVYSVGRQANTTYPALVNTDEAKLIHVGPFQQHHTEIFAYQDQLIDHFTLIATRYGNFQGRMLASDGTLLTDSWTINFSPNLIRPRSNAVLSTEITNQVKLNIEAALLSHPLWPSDFGQPKRPARFVSFIFD